MKDKPISILSTRPLDEALVEKAAFQNIRIETFSFITIKQITSTEVQTQVDQLSKVKATVVFTSMNAVENVVNIIPGNLLMPDWKIYCIGGATFTLVKKYWPFNNIAYTAPNATELAEKVIINKEDKIHFFCGNKRREELPGLLMGQGIQVKEYVVYETIETPEKIDSNYNGILFFSPSTVTSYFSYNTPPKYTIFFAIGNTTANALKQISENNIIISDFPAKDQLVDKAIRYFSEKVNE